MTIDRIGPLDPVSKFNKTERTIRPADGLGKDSIDVSNEAKSKAEMLRVLEEVRLAPDIREDRVAEIKRKLEDPNYINDKVVESVAESVMQLFKI
jgi:negative regulator of flagellin synthesis FlgM